MPGEAPSPGMCSRYNLVSPPEAIRALFGLGPFEPFPPRYNIAPTQPVAIVRTSLRGEPELALVRWGLVPSWVKDPREYSLLVNARLETAAEKPSFRGSLRHRRCLVPADGFYEWSGRRGDRIPHLIRLHKGGPMVFAGLWEHWLGADGSEVETMAILTRPADGPVRQIHDRMPVIVSPDQFSAWLDCRSGSAVEVLASLVPLAGEGLDVVEIGTAINDVRHEGPRLIEPVRRKLL